MVSLAPLGMLAGSLAERHDAHQHGSSGACVSHESVTSPLATAPELALLRRATSEIVGALRALGGGTS